MGFLDKIREAAQALGAEGGHHQSILDGVVDIVKRDGIQGIVNQFRERGLGDTISSWIGTGENRNISPEQIREGLGSERIREIASRAGISEEQAAEALRRCSPDIDGPPERQRRSGRIRENIPGLASLLFETN
jgi:uncharacterized protein YidB (DUF937 family)